MFKSRVTARLILLLVLSAGVRSAALAARWSHLSSDPDAYRLIAENLRAGGVYSRTQSGSPLQPTAFRPPLYPLLLATCAWGGRVTPLIVAALHLVLGVLSVWLAWLVARQWGLAEWSYLVAILVACDPILANQSTEVMTETLATTLALVALLALTRMTDDASWKVCLAAGAALGLATLCRPTFLIWAGLAGLWLLVRWRWSTGILSATLMLVGCTVILAPWVIRNQIVMGHPIIATTHGGYTLLLGNNRPFYEHLRTARLGSVWDARELLPLVDATLARDTASVNDSDQLGAPPHSEIVADQRLYELARETIGDELAMFAYASLIRVGRLWTPLPHQLSDDESAARSLLRWAIGLWYVVAFVFALAGVWQLGRRVLATPWVWGLTCMLALTLVHSVYWSNMRMRAPAMPVVYLLVAVGCSQVWWWVARRDHSGPNQDPHGC